MSLFKPNQIFAGRYNLTGLTGKGEFSEVWKATDQMADGAVVSLKIFASDVKPTEEAVSHFRQQFSVSQKVSHPHLLKFYHYDVSEGLPYLVMPFCPCGSLAGLTMQEAKVSERQIATIISHTGAALEALHHHKPPLRHGNVKPENILATQENYFILADADSGNETGSSTAVSPSYPRKALAAYAPPESFDQFRHSDTSADIFSLGVTLYEIATKTLPWDGKGGKALLTGDKIPDLPKHYSPELNELLRACMSTDKNKRPRAKELYLRGKNYTEKGHWNIPEEEEEERKPLKKQTLLLVAAATFVLLALGSYGLIKNQFFSVPTAGLQNKGESASGKGEQNVDEMLIATLEDQLEDMTSRARELEEENEQLKQKGPLATVQEETPEATVEEVQEPLYPESKPTDTKAAAAGNVISASGPSAGTPEEDSKLPSPKDYEKLLNRASDPAISGKAREAWRKEMLAQFSEGPVKILDETDGTPKRFSTRIFINLLYRVPHKVVVKEVKTDRNQKISEIRLEMQPES